MKQIEIDLTEAFARHASQIPAEAVARLRQADYHPRTRRVSPIQAGAFAGAGATAAAVASVVLLTGAAPAFAGWTATPTQPSRGQLAAADSTCQAALTSLPDPAGTAWASVVTDVTGSFTLTVYDNGTNNATCLVGPSVTTVSELAGSGGGGMSVVNISDGQGPGSKQARAQGTANLLTGSADGISSISMSQLSSTSQGEYSVATGALASDVSGVSLTLSDGSTVVSTVGGGWFVAWWPGSADATSATITTPSGTTTEPLSLGLPGDGVGRNARSGAHSRSGSRG